MNADDWRLQGQERYLKGAVLTRGALRDSSSTTDHEHCEFCGAKFSSLETNPPSLTIGYHTIDDYRWICEDCFRDFRERFEWIVK